MSAIFDLPLSMTVELISHAIEDEKENTAWDLWKTVYPLMVKNQIETVEFIEFKDRLFSKEAKYSEKSIGDIETEMMDIVSAYESR